MQPQLQDDILNFISNLQDRIELVEKSLTNDSVPIGSKMIFTGSASLIPFNYLPADGRDIDRIGYAAYFAQVGTTYGVGDGASTFNIPNDTVFSSGTMVAYAEITSSVTVSGTSGAQTTVVTASSFTADGTTPYWVEFYTPEGISAASDILAITIWEAGTQLDQIAQLQPATVLGEPIMARRKFTPAAGTRTYQIRAFRVSSNGTVTAGVGGTLAFSPAYIRVMSESLSDSLATIVVKVL